MSLNYFKVAVWSDVAGEVFQRLAPIRRPRPLKLSEDRLDLNHDHRSLDGREVRNWVFVFDDLDATQLERAQGQARGKLNDLRAAGVAPLLSVFRHVPGGPPVIGETN